MASVHHQVQFSASDPVTRTPLEASTTVDPAAPPSPREGKRKKLTHEVSSPNVSAKQRKHSHSAKGRHSIVIEPPKMCAKDTSFDYGAASRSETSSIHSEISEECFIELDETALTRIHYIVQELINTEKVYMQDLQSIVAGYIDPMRNEPELFNPDSVTDIFINIVPIGDFHLDFLEKLDTHKQELDRLANCFLTKESEQGFALYNEFCRKVPRSLDLIGGYSKDHLRAEFIDKCKRDLGHFFPLSEFIHRPIQRILKYPLLLRDLQKYARGSKYAAGVEAALDKITGVAIHINKVKRVQELESNEIIGWPGDQPALLDFGVLKLEQSFKVNGSDSRYIFLFDKLLLITKIVKDGKYQYKAHLLPTDIKMKEGATTDLKFEIEKFKSQKKNNSKFTIQAADFETKATWVYEIKRSLLENQDGISQQAKDVLLKGIPSMDKTNQFNDILHNSKYKSFIYLRGFEDADSELGPTSPDIHFSPEKMAPSPGPCTPPSHTMSPLAPSPDRNLHYDDSGIEDPAPKNQVDYSSLDVKAIKDRWKQQEKMASNPSSTAPARGFHRTTMSPVVTPSKLETWPLPDSDPGDQLKRNNKGMGDNVRYEGSRSPVKPCLARISHLQEQKDERTSPVYRDIRSLIEADAAHSQARYDELLSPDSNTHPDCEGGFLVSGLEPQHGILSPKQSNGSDDVFSPSETKTSTIRTNLNNKVEVKKCKDTFELSDGEDTIVTITKTANVSGTDTTKRNSFIIEKDLNKNVSMFSPQSSDSELGSGTELSTSDRIELIKRRAAKLKKRDEARKNNSLTDTIMGMYDEQLSKSNRTTPEDEVSEKLSSLRVSEGPTPTNRTLTRDDDTLTRDGHTLTRDNAEMVYQGSSLIRRTPDDGIVMKPIRDNMTPSPRTLNKNRIHRRAARRGGRVADTSDSESECSSNKSAMKPNRSGLPKPVTKSESSSSVQSIRSRTGSGSSANSTKPVTGAVVQSATVKRAALKARTSSFNQEDNPFVKPDSDSSLKPSKIGASERQSVGSATKSVTTDSPRVRARGTRLCSEGLAADRRSAYLTAAQSSSTTAPKNKSESGSKTKTKSKIEADPEIQELNSVRSSQLVARMKSQLLNTAHPSKLKAPSRSTTLKRRHERSNTTMIAPRSRSSPALSRRSSEFTRPPSSAGKTSDAGPKPSGLSRKISSVQPRKPTPSTKPADQQKRQSVAGPKTGTQLRSRSSTVVRRPSSVQKPAKTPAAGATKTRPGTLKSDSGTPGTKKITRIPSPVKSPAPAAVKTSSSTSRLAPKSGIKTSASSSKITSGQAAGPMRPKVNSASSRLQNGSKTSRVKNSASNTRLKYKQAGGAKLRTSQSSPTLQESSPAPPRLTSAGKAIKTPRRPSGLGGRSTSLADLNNKNPVSVGQKPNLSKLQTLSKSTSCVNEKSVRLARREAAQKRAAGVARSRDGTPDTPQEVPEGRTGLEGKMKFLYGAHRSDSRA